MFPVSQYWTRGSHFGLNTFESAFVACLKRSSFHSILHALMNMRKSKLSHLVSLRGTTWTKQCSHILGLEWYTFLKISVLCSTNETHNYSKWEKADRLYIDTGGSVSRGWRQWLLKGYRGWGVWVPGIWNVALKSSPLHLYV